MLPDRFKSFFGDSSSAKPVARSRAGSVPHEAVAVSERASRGLEHFFFNIRDLLGLSILDLGGATQENIDFIGNLGHRITTQAFLRTLDDTFGRDQIHEQTNPRLIESFLDQNLGFADETFDAVLVWDVLQYMSPALLTATVDEIYRITRPGSYVLGFFNSDERGAVSADARFRILAANRFSLTQKGTRKQGQAFNNRSIERLFGKFESVKFFLTRESLREVIIRR